MAIDINPNNINLSSGLAGRLGERFRQPESQPQPAERPKSASKQAPLNLIPSNESLQTQVRSALEARRAGSPPDRGSILNLLV